MIKQEAYTVRARISHERNPSGVVVDDNGNLPSAEFVNDPETHNTAEGLAKELARRALGHIPSIDRAEREPGSVTYHFIADRNPAIPDIGYRWHTEPIEPTIEA